LQVIYSPNTLDTDFYIEHTKIASGTSMKTEHYHDFYELYFYLGDGMRYFIGNKTFYVKKYDLILIDKFTYHRTSYKEKGFKERLLIYLYDDVINIIGNEILKQKIVNLFKKKKISFYSSFSKYMLDTLMNRVLPKYYNKSNPSISQLQARLVMLDLLLEIAEMDENGQLIEDNSITTPQENRVSDIVSYINSNYSKQITLDELSKIFFINKYYLCHIFKEVTGMSITDFINRKRLAESKKLLKYTDYNITEISQMVGFNSVSRFISLFREKFEETPKSFRESK